MRIFILLLLLGLSGRAAQAATDEENLKILGTTLELSVKADKALKEYAKQAPAFPQAARDTVADALLEVAECFKKADPDFLATVHPQLREQRENAIAGYSLVSKGLRTGKQNLVKSGADILKPWFSFWGAHGKEISEEVGRREQAIARDRAITAASVNRVLYGTSNPQKVTHIAIAVVALLLGFFILRSFRGRAS